MAGSPESHWLHWMPQRNVDRGGWRGLPASERLCSVCLSDPVPTSFLLPTSLALCLCVLSSVSLSVSVTASSRLCVVGLSKSADYFWWLRVSMEPGCVSQARSSAVSASQVPRLHPWLGLKPSPLLSWFPQAQLLLYGGLKPQPEAHSFLLSPVPLLSPGWRGG